MGGGGCQVQMEQAGCTQTQPNSRASCSDKKNCGPMQMTISIMWWDYLPSEWFGLTKHNIHGEIFTSHRLKSVRRRGIFAMSEDFPTSLMGLDGWMHWATMNLLWLVKLDGGRQSFFVGVVCCCCCFAYPSEPAAPSAEEEGSKARCHHLHSLLPDQLGLSPSPAS